MQASYWANGLVWVGLAVTAIFIGSLQDYLQIKAVEWKRRRTLRRNCKDAQEPEISLHRVERASASPAVEYLM